MLDPDTATLESFRHENAGRPVPIAVLFTAAGSLAHSVATADNLTPGELIAAARETQLDVLTNVQGDARVRPWMPRASRGVSFSSLSLGLALQYDRLSDRHERDLATLIVRARTLEQPDAGFGSLAVLACMQEDGAGTRISDACISSAVKRR